MDYQQLKLKTLIAFLKGLMLSYALGKLKVNEEDFEIF